MDLHSQRLLAWICQPRRGTPSSLDGFTGGPGRLLPRNVHSSWRTAKATHETTDPGNRAQTWHGIPVMFSAYTPSREPMEVLAVRREPEFEPCFAPHCMPS